MSRKIELSLVIGVLACSVTALAQAPQERIIQPIIVNGQQAQGALIVQDGTIQSQTCAAPQRYVAADQSSSGWACFEPSTVCCFWQGGLGQMIIVVPFVWYMTFT